MRPAAGAVLAPRWPRPSPRARARGRRCPRRAERAPPGPPECWRRRGGASAHTPRFQFLFGALGALSVAAVALAVALLRAPAPTPEAPWSAWRPLNNEVDPAEQIAAYVAPQYRFDGGRQIVQVSGGPPSLKGQPLTVGIVHSGQTPAALEGNNVLYQLCGDGANCSIKEGKPSVQRGLLLDREALELALYTFRYVSGVGKVLVTIPPPPPTGTSRSSSSSGGSLTGTSATPSTTGGDASTSTSSTSAHVIDRALLFDSSALAGPLSRPLSETLSPVTPQVSQIDGWPDTATVRALIEPRLYDFTISETQQTGAVMLLEPLSLGG